MRLSLITVFTVLATAVPSLSRPANIHYARKSTSGISIPEEKSGGSGTLGKIATGASVVSAAVPFVEEIFHHFFGNSTKRSDGLTSIEELLSRAVTLAPLQQRQLAEESSEALKLPSFSQLVNIGSIASSAANIFHDIFGESSSSNATRRELVEHFVRTVNATVASDDRSEAFSFGSLFKDISSVGSIIGDGVSIFDDLLGGSSGNSTKVREFAETLARRAANSTDDSSEAFSFGSLFNDISSVGSLIGDGVSIFDDIFGSSSGNSTKAREFIETLVRRVEDSGADDSEAFSLGSLFKGVSSVGSLIGDGVTIFDDIFGESSGNSTLKRRSAATVDSDSDSSEALALWRHLFPGIDQLMRQEI